MVIRLVSGLPLSRPHSFARQLDLLRRALAERGHDVRLVGPAEVLSGEGACPRISHILLGYPDQFGSAGAPRSSEERLFLWAQFSRPPNPRTTDTLRGMTCVPLTPRTADHLRKAGVDPAPVIPHGVDTELLRPRLPGRQRPDKAPLIGSVGANSFRKRFDRLLAAFSLIARRQPRARFVIKTDRAQAAGGFDLPRMSRALDLDGRLEVIDRELDESELAALYRSLDLYVHAAEWEGFGIPVIEAMAGGVPVVAPDTQGPAEVLPYTETVVSRGERVLQDGTELFWVDPEALAAAALLALSDGGLREELAARGVTAARARFDIRRVAEMWERLLVRA